MVLWRAGNCLNISEITNNIEVTVKIVARSTTQLKRPSFHSLPDRPITSRPNINSFDHHQCIYINYSSVILESNWQSC